GQRWSWKRRDVARAPSRAHSANHCWHRARCSSGSALPASLRGCSSSTPPPTASWPCCSCSSCVTLSLSSWMVSSSRRVTRWGSQLPSMAGTKGSGAHTSMSSPRAGMRR
ncbi:hypothetical protein N305_14922, partial [Manacus vitellinus]